MTQDAQKQKKKQNSGMTPEKLKRKLFSGVFFLTVSNFLAKLCGLFLKVPLTNLLGDRGMAYFNLAYAVYRWFFILLTAGLPVAAAVLTAEARACPARGMTVFQIRKLSLLLFSAVGLLGSAWMFFGASGFASLAKAPQAVSAIAAVSPAVFFICMAGALRGWYQGLGSFLPASAAQTAEAAVKTVCGLFLASRALRAGKSVPLAAAHGITGLTLGCLAGLLVLLLFLYPVSRQLKREGQCRPGGCPSGTVLRRMLALSVPVTLSASVLSLCDMADSMLLIRRLCDAGFSHGEALRLYGTYTSLAVPMFHLPPMLITPLTSALIPVLSSAPQEKRPSVIAGAVALVTLLALPCSTGLSAAAEPLLGLVFREDLVKTGAPLLAALAPAAVFLSVTTVCSAVLQACGCPNGSLCAMLAGTLVKLASGFFLTGHPACGIFGAPASTVLCYAVTAAVSLCFVVKKTGTALPFAALAWKPLLCSLFCAAAARAGIVFFAPAGRIGAVLCGIGTGAAVYFASLLLLHGIPQEVSGLLRRGTQREG